MTKLIIIMGVSGSGKSFVGTRLSRHLGIPFVDGDDLHPPENVERMRAGIKLNDETRKPWLAAICQCAEDHFKQGDSVIIACSALKKKYRDQIRTVSRPVHFIFLNGPAELIAKRMGKREGHYMPALLLDSQFADLEIPSGESSTIEIKIAQTPESMLSEIVSKLEALES